MKNIDYIFNLDRKVSEGQGFLVTLDNLSIKLKHTIYSISGNSERGVRAHKNAEHVLICLMWKYKNKLLRVS